MQISPYFILICVLDTVILFTILASRKNIGRRAAKEVLAALILAFLALVFFGLSLLITNERLRFVLHELKFLPLAYIPPCSLMVYCEFTDRPLSMRRKLLLCVIPFIMVILVLTNSLHHVFRKELHVIYHNGISYVATTSAWGYMVYSAYSYLLYIAGICMLGVNYYKMPRLYRDQIGFMVFTAIFAVLVSFAVLARVVPDYGDISLVTCCIVVIVQYITIVNYSYRRVKLKAWNLIVGDLDNLVMIFDHNDTLVDSNGDASKFEGMIKTGAEYLAEPEAGADGSVVYFPVNSEFYSISEKRLYDNKSRYTGRVLVIKDISSQENAADELEYISTHDYLTGLENRLAFRLQLQSLNESDLPAALVCINIMGMKLINDIFGNEYGDRVIIRLAREMERLTEGNCSCMRLGGDEMGVIMRETSVGGAKAFISKLRDSLLNSPDLIEVYLEAKYVVITDNTQNTERLFSEIAGTMRKDSGIYSRSVSQRVLNSLQSTLMFLHDKTGRRTQQITELCMRVAERLSLSDEERESLRMLSAVSDIGLLSVSPSILKSRGDLLNEQWNEWKLHTIKGHNIALSVKELSPIAKEILAHHERYDGYGYPLRLKGGEIPLLSRVLSAVEFYVDAPPAKALAMLRSRSGTQFDPVVTEALLAVCDSK